MKRMITMSPMFCVTTNAYTEEREPHAPLRGRGTGPKSLKIIHQL